MNIVTDVLGIFTNIGEWFASIVPTLMEIFYNSTDGSLTFVGALAVCGVAIGTILLVLNIVRSYLRFR